MAMKCLGSNMAFDTISLSSDDDVPLNMVGEAMQMHPLSIGLNTRSVENCEFCDVVSYSRYDALIHNGKHIIIPLIKQKLHQCTICLYYFTSQYKLKHHVRNKHKNEVLQTPNINAKTNVIEEQKNIINKSKQDNNESKNTRNNNHVKFELDNDNKEARVVTIYSDDDDDDEPLKKYDSDDDRPLITIESKLKPDLKTELVIYSGHAIQDAKDTILKDVKVVVEKFEPAILSHHKVSKSDHETTTTKSEKTLNSDEVPEPESILKTSKSKPKISSRLRFEDDDDMCDDEIIKDLTTDCIVDMNLFDEPWLDEIAKSITEDGLDMDDIINVDDDTGTEASIGTESIGKDLESDAVVEESNIVVDEEYPPSVHHEELIKPGVYRCKRCPEMFPTRFNQIQHEMTHIHIRKPRPVLCEYCERFFPTRSDLKDHITSSHSQPHRPRPFQSCKKCHLKYNNYNKHLEIYHLMLRCHLCNKCFDNEFQRLDHIRGHLIKKKCDKCDFIALELEIQEHKKLFHKESVLTEKCFNLCEMCCLFLKNKHNNQYVVGETVSKIGIRRPCEHCGNKFFHLTQVKRYGKSTVGERFTFEKERQKKKKCSNTERLKNIQQRLKMINKLSRF